MPENQLAMFGQSGPKTKDCVRCGIRCRAMDQRNPNANIFVKGDMKTGRFCANCLVVDFFKNFELGPASAMGPGYFDPGAERPGWWIDEQDGPWEERRQFDPECLREPGTRQQFRMILSAARGEYAAELTAEEIDWDEVVANWHLPFPPRGRPKKGKGKR